MHINYIRAGGSQKKLVKIPHLFSKVVIHLFIKTIYSEIYFSGRNIILSRFHTV